METIKINLRCQSWEWAHRPSQTTLREIEFAGRTCYKSEKNVTNESAKTFVRNLLKSGHMSVIEHSFASIKVITSRAVANELVRHRLASFSQESTRYVNYQQEGIEIIYPEWTNRDMTINEREISIKRIDTWYQAIKKSIKAYDDLLDSGLRPEDARGVLPLDLKTELVISANLREWIHIFELRISPPAHPQMKQLMKSILPAFKQAVPVLFDSI